MGLSCPAASRGVPWTGLVGGGVGGGGGSSTRGVCVVWPTPLHCPLSASGAVDMGFLFSSVVFVHVCPGEPGDPP